METQCVGGAVERESALTRGWDECWR